MKLSEKSREAIFKLQKMYPEKRSALIPALHIAQNEIGYLPIDIQAEVAEMFDLVTNEVTAVVTFYDMFYERPVGKHLIHVCKNVSCMLRGCDKLLKGLCDRLQIEPGETTADGQFTIIPSECLAACDRAPMLLADDQVYGPVKEDEIDSILQKLKKSKGHPSPVEHSEEANA